MYYTTGSNESISGGLLFRKLMAKLYFAILLSISFFQLYHQINPPVSPMDQPRKMEIVTKKPMTASPFSLFLDKT